MSFTKAGLLLIGKFGKISLFYSSLASNETGTAQIEWG